MRASLVASAVLHVVLLLWALVSIGAPAAFEVANVESVPVDIIPVQDITQIQQGDEKAPAKEKSAPIPTTKPTKVDNAENVGDNDVDLKTPPTPIKRPENVETAAAPQKTEKVLPKTDTKPNDVKEIQKEETETAPATEVAPKAEPKQDVKPDPTPKVDPKPEVKPDPKPDPKPVEQPTPDTAEATPEQAIPDNVPVPSAKPKQETKPDPKPVEKPVEAKTAESQTAKTPDRKKDEQKKETAKSASSKQSDFNADDVAALLNKQTATGGGAKRSTDQAALGGKKTTGGSKLSASEMDALRGQIQNNWSIIPGMADAQDVRVQVKFKLDEAGDIIGDPVVTVTGGSAAARDALSGGAYRAVKKSAPFKNLPRDKYDAWSEVIVNFDPSELL